MKKTVFLIILFSFSLFIYGQNSQNDGRIVHISQKIQNQTWLSSVTDVDFSYSILKSNFNWQTIKQEDSIRELQKLPRRIGFSLPIDLNLLNDITPIQEEGYYIYRYKIYAEDAKKVGFVFDDFYLQPGDAIYIANESGQVIGPITETENKTSRMYSTIPINGQEITLIFVKQQNSLALSRLHLSEIVYIYYEEKADKDLGDAQSCQVNINCSPEGDNWQVQKRGVARISFREGSAWYLCSGTLINNTANDGTPYFLTAYHCGGDATAADRNVWKFYFNYERPGCPNTGTPPNNVITGCTYKAGGDISGGSDFQLLLLSSSPSLSWNPYYNGWSKSTTASPSGVGIHHPSGDAKKISTYTQTLTTGTWSGGMSSAHWLVKWAQTTNGWGVTEGGSSGSPLFDNNKRVIGTLTGGNSDCSNQSTATDYYGKFSKHWDANGTSNDKKLQPWLDPLGTNPTTLDGYDPNNPSGVNNPQNFTAGAISQSQINLSWSLNSSNNPVLLVYNTTNTFGTPTNGTNYTTGQTLSGGGTVIYKGSNTSFAHTGLNAGTTYYYKIFSIATGNNYSSGLTAQATTWWQGAGFSLDFEACADWSTNFTPWTSYDGDGKTTFGSSDCNFTGEQTAFGFMAFNPSIAGCFSTHGGQRCGVSICPSDASESNDWIISPQIQMRNNGSISFWVYSPKPSTWGNETYDVLVSTTNNQPSSFTAIASNETAPNQWTQKTYSLSAYNNQAIYIAIRHRATDKFMMMIDDIVIDTGTVSSTNPVASFTYSPSNICQGTQVQFTNTSQNATSYSWSFPGGNPSTSTQTNPTVTFNTAGNINVTLIAHNGTISDTITQSVTVNPLPTVSASANPSSICVGGSSILSASGANTYNWSNGMNGAQITVSPSTTTTYTVTGTSTAGCTNTSTVMVNINTSINITATANPSNICLGGSTVLTANGGGSYSWSNSMTGSTITVSPTSTTTYSVTGSSGGCTGTATVSVTVNPLPAVSASANPSSICVGGSSVLSASGANTYNWSNNMTGSQITVSPATSSTYTVTGTNLNGCTNTATVSITVNALPTININANPQYICTGNNTVLSASGATSYNWSNGMTGSTITVYPTNTTIYTVTGTNSSNCSNTATISVTVETTPNAGTISASNTQLCQNDILTLTLNGYSPNSNIQWQISTDGTNWNDIAGATSSTYNYTFTSAGIYNFRAKVSNSCTSVYSDQIIITVNPLPTPGTASANITTICQNNSVILTLSGYSSGTTIQWQTSTNNISWNNISGANSAVYNYTPTNAGTIYIRAQVTNNCGSVFSNSITINVEAIPNGGIINSSSNTICQNDNVTLVLTGQTPMTSLQWQLSTDNITWFNISGANASNYNFIANNLGTYYYRVIVSNNCGTATSEEVSITVNPIPPTPTITLISSYPPILYSNATAGNQWYNVNGAIPGATNQTYQVIENGTYYVIVTQNNCQSLPSNVITIDNVSIESYNNNDVIVYPIPANDMIYIQTNKNISELQLIDAIGRVVIISNDSQIDVSNLSNGVYQLLIKSDNDRLILPVIIEK